MKISRLLKNQPSSRAEQERRDRAYELAVLQNSDAERVELHAYYEDRFFAEVWGRDADHGRIVEVVEP